VLAERYADGVIGRLATLAEALVRLNPDLVFAGSTSAALAVTKLTRTVPVVSAALVDPIAQGLLASFAQPGGTVTGVAIATDTLPGKQLELAAELVPGPGTIGMLGDPGTPSFVAQEREAYAAAERLGVELLRVDVHGPGDLASAFEILDRAAPKSLLVLPHPMFLSERRRIAALALDKRIPTIYGFREDVEAGGLMSYGIDLRAAYHRVATHADKILKGARPGDLPVEFPTRMELLINLRTAKALGVKIPLALLTRADEVIE
jgi:putative ABC transport system substrate-binding protein